MFHGVPITIPLDFSFQSKISILTVNIGILYRNLNHTHLCRNVFLCFCYFMWFCFLILRKLPWPIWFFNLVSLRLLLLIQWGETPPIVSPKFLFFVEVVEWTSSFSPWLSLVFFTPDLLLHPSEKKICDIQLRSCEGQKSMWSGQQLPWRLLVPTMSSPTLFSIISVLTFFLITRITVSYWSSQPGLCSSIIFFRRLIYGCQWYSKSWSQWIRSCVQKQFECDESEDGNCNRGESIKRERGRNG